MGQLSYMKSVVDRNVIVLLIPVIQSNICICDLRSAYICHLVGGSGSQFIVVSYIFSILPSARSSQQTQYHSVVVPVRIQITAARHAIQTDCVVGVTVVGSTCCDILVMVGDLLLKTAPPATLRQEYPTAEQFRLTSST